MKTTSPFVQRIFLSIALFLLILLPSCKFPPFGEAWSLVGLITQGERLDSKQEIVEVRNCGFTEIKSTSCSAGTSNDLTTGLGVGGNTDHFSINAEVSSGLGLGRDSGEEMQLETPPQGSMYVYTINKDYRVVSGDALLKSESGKEQTTSYTFHASCSIKILSREVKNCSSAQVKGTTVPITSTPVQLAEVEPSPQIKKTCPVLPKLVFPQNNQILNTLIPNLSFELSDTTDDTQTELELSTSLDSTYWTTFYRFIGKSNKWAAEPTRNLIPSTTYYWRAITTCNGKKTSSETWSFTTGSKGYIMPAPKAVVTVINPTSVDIQWQPLYGVKGYLIQFGKQGPSKSIFHITDPKVTHIIQAIEPGNTYEIIVSAYNDYAIGESNTLTYP